MQRRGKNKCSIASVQGPGERNTCMGSLSFSFQFLKTKELLASFSLEQKYRHLLSLYIFRSILGAYPPIFEPPDLIEWWQLSFNVYCLLILTRYFFVAAKVLCSKRRVATILLSNVHPKKETNPSTANNKCRCSS